MDNRQISKSLAKVEKLMGEVRDIMEDIHVSLGEKRDPHLDMTFDEEELGLSIRTQNVLKRAGISTVGELREKGVEAVRHHGGGNKTTTELYGMISRLGL